MDPLPATLDISRISNPDAIRVRIEIGSELIDIEVTLANFSFALTGRAGTPAKVVRRINLPTPSSITHAPAS